MAKYIDANELLDWLKHSVAEYETADNLYSDDAEKRTIAQAQVAALQAVRAKLKVSPAADVQKVRHGEWANEYGFMTCSLCGYYSSNRDDEGIYLADNYCPRCGAKMDGKEIERCG